MPGTRVEKANRSEVNTNPDRPGQLSALPEKTKSIDFATVRPKVALTSVRHNPAVPLYHSVAGAAPASNTSEHDLVFFGILSLTTYLAGAIFLTFLSLRRFESAARQPRLSNGPSPASTPPRRQPFARLGGLPAQSLSSSKSA